MSDIGNEAQEWRLYIQDMVDFCEAILSYTYNMDQGEFLARECTYDATLRNLQLVGQAAAHVPNTIREAHPEIPWSDLIVMRKDLVQGYLDIDHDAIWSIIQRTVPQLRLDLQNLQNATKEDSA